MVVQHVTIFFMVVLGVTMLMATMLNVVVKSVIMFLMIVLSLTKLLVIVQSVIMS